MPEEYRYPNGRWKHDDWAFLKNTTRISTARRVPLPFRQDTGASEKKWMLWDQSYPTARGTIIETRPIWTEHGTFNLPHALVDCAVEGSGWASFSAWLNGEWVPCFKQYRAVHFGRRLAYYSGGLKQDLTVSPNPDGSIRSDIMGWIDPPTCSWNKIILLTLLVLASPSFAITLSTARSDCRVLIKDTGPSRTRFSDAQLLRFLNEGQKDLVQFAKPIRKSTQFELVSGTTYYSAPANFLAPIRVTRSYQLLSEQSVQSLDKQISWQTVRGLPISYFVNHSSRSLIGFYPFPDAATSIGTIRMEYSAQATDLSADSDEPFNGIVELQPYGYLLPFYCAYRASLIDNEVTQAQAYYAEFKRGSDMLASDAFSRPNYKPGAVGGTSGAP